MPALLALLVLLGTLACASSHAVPGATATRQPGHGPIPVSVAQVTGAHEGSKRLAGAKSGIGERSESEIVDGWGGGRWEIDLESLVRVWPEVAGIERLAEAFELEIVYRDRVFEVPTHLFTEPIRVVPFSDHDGGRDAEGRIVERGDAELVRFVPRGSLALAVKGHRPMRRKLSVSGFAGAAVEELGLADNHLSVLVGIEKDDAARVITVSMPQGYAGGRIGDNRSPPVFLVPVWPEFLTESQIAEFENNIRTYLVAFHSVGRFSFRYFHGDQLAAHSRESMIEHIAQMVRAIAGDQEARAWFSRSEQQFYCSELAYIAFSAGLTVPLNAKNLVPLVGEETWRRFELEVDRHSEGGPSAFSELSRNPFIPWVDLTLAPADLVSLESLVPAGASSEPKEALTARTASAMIFPPMSAVDIVEMFLRHTVPRESLGEVDGALLQGEVLRQIGGDVLRLLAASGLLTTDREKERARALLSELEDVVATPFADYASFRMAVEPLLEQARLAFTREQDDGVGLFALPSLFHLVAEGQWPAGLVGFRYVGHGIPYSVVRRRLP